MFPKVTPGWIQISLCQAQGYLRGILIFSYDEDETLATGYHIWALFFGSCWWCWHDRWDSMCSKNIYCIWYMFCLIECRDHHHHNRNSVVSSWGYMPIYTIITILVPSPWYALEERKASKNLIHTYKYTYTHTKQNLANLANVSLVPYLKMMAIIISENDISFGWHVGCCVTNVM